MNLTETLQQELGNPDLSSNERILLRCQTAAEFIHRGQYEAACDALGEFWRGVGQRPDVEGLKKATEAELLLRCGSLSSGIGSARSMNDAQEKSKDLISEAQRTFEILELPIKAAEAQSELSICYWRLGAFAEARVVLDEAAKKIGDKDDELKARILVRRALVETWACRYHDALDVLQQAEAFFKKLPSQIKGRWHGQMGLVLKRLGMAEGRTDYLDRAIIEHTAAIYHYEQAQNDRYCAINLNNLAMLLYRVGRFPEAHENLDRAAKIFSKLNDPGNLAQVNETRARVLLAEERYEEAREVIEGCVR
ncbi:MAG: tetratricopeptide repeat protein, partial [Acidobacteria bacterium]|nr:tetratricopeptide repeat protein [Acidobacteriota bacterium]